MKNFLFPGNCCIFVNLGWRTLPTQIKRKVQIFLRLCCCCVHTLHQINLRIAFLFSNFFLYGQGLTLLTFARNWAITWLSIWQSLSCAQSPVDLQETNPCGAECYTHVKVRSQLEMSKVIRDCHCFSLLRSVIGPQKLVPRSQPIRYKANTCHDLVTRVFPRFGPFTCFYFELSLVLQGIFLSFDWSM